MIQYQSVAAGSTTTQVPQYPDPPTIPPVTIEPPVTPPPPVIGPPTITHGGGPNIPTTLNPPTMWTGDPIDDCMRSITVTDVWAAAFVNIFVNGEFAGRAASQGGDTVLGGYTAWAEVPISCSPSVGELVQATQDFQVPNGKLIVSPLNAGVRVVSHVPYSVLTQHYDNFRTGWYPYAGQSWKLINQFPGPSPMLTVTSASKIKKQFVLPTTGQVYAQPLYLHHQFIPGQGAHNIVYIATEENWIFAYDADNGALIWKRQLIQTGELPVDTNDLIMDSSSSKVFDNSKNTGVMNLAPKIGITGTPVIDCGCECGCGDRCQPPVLYVVTKLKTTVKGVNTFHTFLNAIDTATGKDRIARSEIVSKGVVAGSGGDGSVGGNDGHGHLNFLPEWYNQRPALLLQNGVIYIAFAAHGDAHIGDYHGWVFAYDASTLQKLNEYVATPDGSAGGIWQGGMGVAGDGCSVYLTVGNGTFDADKKGRDLGNSVVKLSSKLSLLSSFTPADQKFLNDNDIDLGSGGVLLVPNRQFGSPPNLLIACGKDAEIFVLNRDGLGGFNGAAAYGTYGSNTNAVSSAFLYPGVKTTSKVSGNGIWGGPAYFSGPIDAKNTLGQLIFYCGDGGNLTSFVLNNGVLTANKVSAGGFRGRGGPTPVITSDQQNPGTGLVWAVNHQNPNNGKNISLRAYSVTDLGTLLVKDLDCGPWDTLYKPPVNKDTGKPYDYDAGGPYIEPTVINGKVYVGCDNQVTVFG